MSTISLLGLPFVVALEMIAILGYLGIHVLKREIIFIDIALAQVAAAGAIVAHLAFAAHGDSVIGYACALGATLIAAAFYALVRQRAIRIPLEAVIGVTYAVAAALALFLVGIAPGGHIHIQQMLAGSILWATPKDVVVCAVVFAAAGLCLCVFRKPLAAISDDYEGAVREGMNSAAWDFLFYALVGVVITVAVRIAGVVIVFAFLIIPATLSAIFARGWGMRLVITWIAGAVATGLGLLFAERFDFSVGPSIALFLGAGLVFAGSLRQLRVTKVATAAGALVVVVALFVWLLRPL
ncbi:MAG TPA: iron chelate uptake ABC transporter family permease subunit [Acidobacteriota bacterium]|nr:iron chelate uptake ABC transporter family permease subunit [Acidobacteriota bacterium]